MIRFEQVSYAYPAASDQPVLHDVNVRIDEGEYVAVTGANGSGKSTFARCMNAMCAPTEGTVSIRGMSASEKQHIWSIRQSVGYVFQNPENQFVAATVRDDVAFGLENKGVHPDEMPGRIEQALRSVGMWDMRDVAPHLLSGGQKQRVAIASVLAMEPDVVIFDEATSMLDPLGRQQVLRLIRDFRDRGLTVIHITHDMDEALQAERMLVLRDGRIVADDRPANILGQPSLLEMNGLSSPSVFRTVRWLRSRGLDIPQHIRQEEELVSALWTLRADK